MRSLGGNQRRLGQASFSNDNRGTGKDQLTDATFQATVVREASLEALAKVLQRTVESLDEAAAGVGRQPRWARQGGSCK